MPAASDVPRAWRPAYENLQGRKPRFGRIVLVATRVANDWDSCANSQRQAKSHNPKVFDSKESHPKQHEFAVWPQIPTGMLQPTFVSPGRARIAVNDGFRSLPGSES